MALIDALYEILERLGMVVVVFLGPIGVAFFIGIIIGWAWKPKLSYSVSKAFDLSSPSSPLASLMSPLKGLRSQSSEAWTMNTGEDKGQSSVPPTEYDDCRYLGFIDFSIFSIFWYYSSTIWICGFVTFFRLLI